MTHNVGIWIDHTQAVIVTVTGEEVTARTVKSHVGPHVRYAGAQDGGGEQKYEERHRQALDRFFDEVIDRLGTPEAILIFGPGPGKVELRERLRGVRALAKVIVRLETTDKLTQPQIVAKVKEHYQPVQ